MVAMMALPAARAQVYMADVMKPTSQRRYQGFRSTDKALRIARYDYKGGFKLKTGQGGLISADDPGGHAVFHLGGTYEKLSFVVGPDNPNSAGDSKNVIVTVSADGETLFDEVVWDHDAPREVVLDVKGAQDVRFEVLRGETELAFGAVRLWKAGQKPTAASNPLAAITSKRAKMVDQLWPYYILHTGWVAAITQRDADDCQHEPSISINRVEYTSGLRFTADQALAGNNTAWAYFWLQKKYDKVAFIVGPRDNQSSNFTGWLTVKGDGKILFEKRITQKDLAEQVVIDVSGVNQLSFHSIDEGGDFLGGLTFGVVDITAYQAGDASVPQAGIHNGSKERISKLPDVCRMCSNIKPYSVRGVAKNSNTYFDGSTRHYTFSMGGVQFWEGFILTTGTTLFDDNINAYAAFDLAGEYDYVSFTAGCLTQHRVLNDDIIRVYADDKLILETTIHATWPNQHFELPINRCRTLRFEKPGNGESKQVYFGIADVVLYRGKVVDNNLFVHEKPECPETADLIDLCKRPYFHFVGRYLSTLTDFDFNDCFKNGSSQREFFQMKDGSKIYKGFMLETNIPLGFEDMTFTRALCLMFTPVFAAGIDLAVCDEKGHQSSMAAFNPYREYESVTFTVANKSVYVDPFDEMIGGKHDAPPVTLYVIADQHQVAEITLSDKMQPTTYTVPINRCEQLMFWMQCGDVRSGQYVFYDLKVSKQRLPQTPGTEPKTSRPIAGQKKPATAAPAPRPQAQESKKEKKKSKPKKEKPLVVWEVDRMSGDQNVDNYLNAVSDLWNATLDMQRHAAPGYTMSTDYVQAADGTVYKAVSFRDAVGTKQSIASLRRAGDEFAAMEKEIKKKAVDADLYLPSATLAVPNLGERMFKYGKLLKLGGEATAQCRRHAAEMVELRKMADATLEEMVRQAVTVDGIQSSDHTLLVPLSQGETMPEGANLQQLRYYSMD